MALPELVTQAIAAPAARPDILVASVLCGCNSRKPTADWELGLPTDGHLIMPEDRLCPS
jgi:hypothetical protein